MSELASGFSKADIINTFKHFHQHPELSFEELETTKKIAELLSADGIEILPLPLKTGLAARIIGGKAGASVALRCDIDALPVTEESGLDYSSKTSGKMHACGHDFHTTTMLYAAKLLQSRRERLAGTVIILFQAAEESSVGALDVVKTGVLDDVSAIFGIHADNTLPVGTVSVQAGSVTAGVDRFVIRLMGKGCHAAHPHEGADPIVAGAALVSAVQTIVSRNIDPFAQGLLSITRFSAGTTWNVIPETAELEGTIRTLGAQTRKLMETRLRAVVENISAAYGVRAELDWQGGPPATDNSPLLVGISGEVAEEIGLELLESPRSLGGEDFAFYQERLAGMFIKIGTGKSYPLHHPKFKVDPEALPKAAEYAAGLAEEALVRLSDGRLSLLRRGRVD